MVSAEESIPSESPDSLYGRSALFRQFNDVDFYVEDEAQENLYYEILRKVVPAIRFENVFALRGKQNLIARAAEQKGENRKSIYILDKDFDDLLGLFVNLENVFYLERFCIENHLLEDVAFVEFVVAELPRMKRAEIAEAFVLRTEIQSTIRVLTKLFSIYFIVWKNSLCPYIKSTGHKPEVFTKGKGDLALDIDKIETYAKQVVSVMKQRGVAEKLSDEIKACQHLFDENDASAKNMSGEYIIFFLLHTLKLRFKLTSNISVDSFRYRLASNCTFHSLDFLRKKIADYLKTG